MKEKADALRKVAHEFAEVVKQWHDPVNYPDVTWADVEKARRGIEQHIAANPELHPKSQTKESK